jgi:hypothetical protein
MTGVGWFLALGIIAVQIAWYVLYRLHIISSYAGIGLLLITCGLATWLLPYFTPVKIGRQKGGVL